MIVDQLKYEGSGVEWGEVGGGLYTEFGLIAHIYMLKFTAYTLLHDCTLDEITTNTVAYSSHKCHSPGLEMWTLQKPRWQQIQSTVHRSLWLYPEVHSVG